MPARPSTSIIAAGICSALIAVILGAISLPMLVLTPRLDLSRIQPDLPPYERTLALIVLIFFLLAAIYLLVCAVGVIGLRKWARVAMLVNAGLLLLFGLTGAAVVAVSAFALPLPGGPGTKIIFAGVLVGIYGAPIAAAIWWLILFTRRSVVAQFEARHVELPQKHSFRVQKPGVPLPIAIVAWFLLANVLNLLVLPFLPFPIPAILFGHVFHGALGLVFIFFLSALIAACSVGLLRLQRWSFPVALFLQVVTVANLLISAMNPNFEMQLRDALGHMRVPAPPPGLPDLSHYARYFSFAGILFPLAFIVCLLYSRKAFYAASARTPATKSSLPQ